MGKKTAGGAFKNEIMQNEKLAEELYKPIIRKFGKRKKYPYFLNNILACKTFWRRRLTTLKTLLFRSNSSLYYISIHFLYRKNKYAKVLNGDIHETSKEPVAERFADQMMGCFTNVCGTSVERFFLNSTWKHIKLTLTSY